MLPPLPTPLPEVASSSLWPQKSVLSGPVDTKTEVRSAALLSDEAGELLAHNTFGDTRAWTKLRAAYAGYSKREGWRDRQKSGRSLYHRQQKEASVCGAMKSPYMAREEILYKELHATRSSSNCKNMQPNGGASAETVSPRAK